MPRFADCLGREWEVRITVPDLKRLKEIGIDCAKVMTSPDGIPEILFGDSERLATALYRVLKPGITPDEFGDGLDGPALEAGGVALLEACILFFPRSRVAEAMRGRILAALEEMDTKLVSLLTTSSEVVGNSPGSSVSTPAR